jgi:hypothetical protein
MKFSNLQASGESQSTDAPSPRTDYCGDYDKYRFHPDSSKDLILDFLFSLCTSKTVKCNIC